MGRTDSSEKTLMLVRLKSRGEGDNRGWDGWMASPTQWIWTWASSGSWWYTGKPGVLKSMGLQSRTRLSDFTFTFYFHAFEKEMATHSSVLSWRIPGKAEPGGLPSMGLHRVGHDRSDLAAAAAACIGALLRQNLHPNFPMETGCSFPLNDLQEIRPRLVSSLFMSCFPWDLTGFSGRIF